MVYLYQVKVSNSNQYLNLETVIIGRCIAKLLLG
jgi:hypothetical protein